MLFYKFYARITTFFDPEKFGTASLLYVDVNTLSKTDVEMTSRRQKLRQNVTIVILTSCTRVDLHHSYKTTFPSPGRFHRNPGRVCKKPPSALCWNSGRHLGWPHDTSHQWVLKKSDVSFYFFPSFWETARCWISRQISFQNNPTQQNVIDFSLNFIPFVWTYKYTYISMNTNKIHTQMVFRRKSLDVC